MGIRLSLRFCGVRRGRRLRCFTPDAIGGVEKPQRGATKIDGCGPVGGGQRWGIDPVGERCARSKFVSPQVAVRWPVDVGKLRKTPQPLIAGRRRVVGKSADLGGRSAGAPRSKPGYLQ